MAQPYVGEVRLFGGNFAPAGWMFCDGQLLPISENETLFNLIGTTYGGDGQSTFALPNLQSRIPIHQGNGRVLAETGGVETVTLTTNQVPTHTHSWPATTTAAVNQSPVSGNMPAASTARYYKAGGGTVAMAASAIPPAGGNQPHTNFMPYACVSYIISLFGIFPSQ